MRKPLPSRVRGFILTLLAALALAVLVVVPAQAAGRTEKGSFGPEGPLSPSGFEEPVSIAVEQKSGDVYVYERGEDPSEEKGNVYKFNAAGDEEKFSSLNTNVIEGIGGFKGGSSQIAVDSSNGPDAGDIYIATGNKVLIYNSAGVALAPLTEVEEPEGVAVDSSGAVYVAFALVHAGVNEIKKYEPVTNPVTTANHTCSLLEGGHTGPHNIAADSANIYVAEEEIIKYKVSQCNTEEIEQSGETVDAAGSTLAVDPASGDVYINEGSDVAVYTSLGARLEEFGSLNESFGVAVNDTSGEVYASAAGEEGKVTIFSSTAPSTEFELKVGKGGTGEGTVTSVPPGINCGLICEAPFEEGKEVTLTDTPETGSEFVKWTGCDTTTGDECKVTMTGAKTVEVKNNLKPVTTPEFALEVKKSGSGAGL